VSKWSKPSSRIVCSNSSIFCVFFFLLEGTMETFTADQTALVYQLVVGTVMVVLAVVLVAMLATATVEPLKVAMLATKALPH
jgi:hypothetical protein